MTVLLTKEQYEDLLKTQEHFDSRVAEYKVENIKIAYFIEFIEFINTLEFFKSWKKNKGKPKEIQLDELADLLAFGLSLQNHKSGFAYAEEIYEEDLNTENKFSVSGFLNEAKGLISILQYEDDYAFFVWIPLSIAKSYFSVNELIEAYYKKMKVNHERQDNNY